MNAKILIPIIIVLGLAGGVFVLLNPPAEPAVRLIVNSGVVEVNTGAQWQTASNNMELKQSWSVRTLEGASATLIFFGGSVMRLDEKTEIVLTSIKPQENDTQLVIKQNGGRTWNRILLLSGIENYEVNTPDAVASVRGTGFCVKDLPDSDDIWASDGLLLVGRKKEDKLVEFVDIGANGLARIERDVLQKTAFVQPDSWISENLAKDDAYYEEVKQKLRNKYAILIEVAKAQGLNEELVNEYLENYVRGKKTIRNYIESGVITEEQAKLLPLELRRETVPRQTIEQTAEELGFAFDASTGTYKRRPGPTKYEEV